ncbi:diaminopimelate decarboxylase [Sporolactobacillus terrae]|nr:diaminopimelate decarboxylase [Sporolactobacillus terrae]QAA24032.1 diaminopimelate decarboxylase [Sporolactobacillus terrae]QAA27000.1 diaminopimelate decarboxylase [Sporolactobacillus terrae]UAK17920.1 diaminopimelate decarboxylase [Sporolactobacillus terrae]
MGRIAVFGTQEINRDGHLYIGGIDTKDLAREFGTPLYVYDTALIKDKINQFKKAFDKHEGITWQIAYASKAFSTLAMIQLVNEQGLSLDVVSGGELFTALKAGMDPKRIHFHGNNKSESELAMALDARIGAVIVDNRDELELLERMCAERDQQIAILLRVTPGIEAHTHEFIMTGQDDSKFGFNLANGMAQQAVQQALQAAHLQLIGIHAHIGSQIFETDGFTGAIRVMLKHVNKWTRELGFALNVLNVGGGFGICYTEKDRPLPITSYIDAIVETAEEECARYRLPLPALWIEPGRSIVGEAGTSLYTVGAAKTIPGIRNYLSVDGGMADNIRPSLYQAEYQAICANRALEPKTNKVAIAGKCCESGDILIKELMLPETCSTGDLLAVFSTGAYGYSMASHYNRIANPAVVFVENGEAALVVRRESYEDLIRYDVPLKNLSPNI